MQSEETAEKNNQQIANLIHDLRTPLTGIMGFAELLLEDTSIVGQNREYAQIILDESKNLEQILAERIMLLND